MIMKSEILVKTTPRSLTLEDDTIFHTTDRQITFISKVDRKIVHFDLESVFKNFLYHPLSNVRNTHTEFCPYIKKKCRVVCHQPRCASQYYGV